MDRSNYIPFDHTYIVYDPESPLTLAVALGSIFPILILVFLFSWFCVTRELESCVMAAGQVINDVISTLLKRIFKIARPVNGQIFKQDSRLLYGMPSSHAQFIAFLTSYLTLKLTLQWPYQVSKPVLVASMLGLALANFVIVYSRLFFEYHNFNQVLVGTLLGAFLGSGYFLAVSLIRDYGLTDWLLEQKPFELLQMKDSFHTAEYRTLGQERREWEEAKEEAVGATEKEHAQ